MTDFFRNHGPVFSPVDAAGGPASSASASQASLGAGSGSSDSSMKAMFDQGMSQQKSMYMEGMQESQQKNELQTQGDAALKTLKAISIS